MIYGKLPPPPPLEVISNYYLRLPRKGDTAELSFFTIIQGDTAGCTRSFVDMNLKVAVTTHR